MQSWVAQQGKTCASAALAGAFNALLHNNGAWRDSGAPISDGQALAVLQGMWQEHIGNKIQEFLQQSFFYKAIGASITTEELLTCLKDLIVSTTPLTLDEEKVQSLSARLVARGATRSIHTDLTALATLVLSLAKMQYDVKPSTASVGSQHLLHAAERLAQKVGFNVEA